MIQSVHQGSRCCSVNIRNNGLAPNRKQKFHCKDCNYYGTLNPEPRYSEKQKAQALRVSQERASLRGVERALGISRQTGSKWLKKKVQILPDLKKTLKPSQADELLELEELGSFVPKKTQKRWLWIALCRRTRQVIAFVLGNRSEKSCKRLWNKIPESTKKCISFSDFWSPYASVFPEKTHHSVGKESGQTNHGERWNNTLRQRISRFVRKTLSFSKKDSFHPMTTKLFIYNYNLSV